MFNTKFLSSYCIAIINIVLVIINLLSSIFGEVLFSFVISIMSLKYSDEDNSDILCILDYFNEYKKKKYHIFVMRLIILRKYLKKQKNIKLHKNIL